MTPLYLKYNNEMNLPCRKNTIFGWFVTLERFDRSEIFFSLVTGTAIGKVCLTVSSTNTAYRSRYMHPNIAMEMYRACCIATKFVAAIGDRKDMRRTICAVTDCRSYYDAKSDSITTPDSQICSYWMNVNILNPCFLSHLHLLLQVID